MNRPSERGNRRLKLIDRILGIPLIYILGGIARQFRARNPAIPTLANPPARVGVLMTAAIGDTILVSAVLRDMQAKWPAARIVLFIGASNRAMRELLRDIEVVEISATRPFAALQKLRASGKFDVFFDTGQWARVNALLSLGASAKLKIGFQTPDQYRHYGYDIAIPHRRDVHELENFRSLVAATGVISAHLPDFSNVGTVNQNTPTPYAVFHMFAGGQNPYQKEWPRNKWRALAKLLPPEITVILTGGPENVKDALAFIHFATLADLRETDPVPSRRFTNAAGKLSLADTAAVLKNAVFVVSVNTGILHLAAATGATTIGLHGPTNAKRWGPLGSNSTSVSSPRGCAPCLNLGFDYACPLDACMREISVERVWQEVTLALKSHGPYHPS
jgi:ADP-heptose:LPS heptosyltransferase